MTGYLAIVVVVLSLTGAAYYLRGVSSKSSETNHSGGSKVLILTAAVGGGHEAVGRTIQAELEQAGYCVAMSDGLRTMSRALNWSLTRGYCSQARNTPKTLGAIFAVTSRRAGAAAVRITVGLLFANRLLEVMRRERPDLVISTYPLVTGALGRLRSRGKLRAPVAAVVADYGVHPLWVAPAVDLHLVVSQCSAELVRRAGGNAAVVRLPVSPGFYSAPARDEAREILGLPPEAFVVLIIGGAWGIGDLGRTALCAAESGTHAVIVTGGNAELKDRLEKRFEDEERIQVLGWRKDMPILMSAADCLIQNAGGMTCLEALEMDLPMLIFDPILGHGELNAHVMELAGAARRTYTAIELGALLRSAARREISLSPPNRELAAPTVSTTLEALAGGAPQPARTRSLARPRPVLAGLSSLAVLLWLAFAPAGVALAAKGLRTHIPGYDPSPGEVSLGVRVTDPATATAVESLVQRERLPVTIFADARAAEGLSPATDLAFGVAQEPGDGELSSPLADRSEAWAAAVGIQRNTGVDPGYFLSASRANLAALAQAPSHTRLVMPDQTKGEPRQGLLIVETSGLSPRAARIRLDQALREIEREGLECVPLNEL